MRRRDFIGWLAALPFVRSLLPAATPLPPSLPPPMPTDDNEPVMVADVFPTERAPVTLWRATPRGSDLSSQFHTDCARPLHGDDVRYAVAFDADMDEIGRHLNAEVIGGRWVYEGYGRFVFRAGPTPTPPGAA